MIAALLLGGVQLLGEAYAFGDGNLAVGAMPPATETFRKLCLRPFPDAAGFMSAIGAEPTFVPVDTKQTATLRRDGSIVPAVGGVWTSSTINVRYIVGGALGPTSGPQCILTVRVAAAADHPAIAASVGAQLSLANGKEIHVGAVRRTYWDLVQPDGQAWRVLLKSESGARGDYVRLSLVRVEKRL